MGADHGRDRAAPSPTQSGTGEPMRSARWGQDRAAPSPSRSGTGEPDRGLTTGARGPPLPPASPGARSATLPVRASPGWPPTRTSRTTYLQPAWRPLEPLRQGPRSSSEELSGQRPTNATRHFRPPGAPTASIRRVVERRVFDEPPSREERVVAGGRRAECTLAGRAVYAIGTYALGYPPGGRG